MRRVLSLALAAAALAGCMVGPDYRRPAQDLPAAYHEPAPPNAQAALPPDWWTLYRDATLTRLVAAGLERNSDVHLATARVEEAEAALREARATAFFPLIEGNAGASRSRTIPNGVATAYTIGVSTSFELDVWGRLRRGENSVRQQLLASRFGADTVRLTLAATITRAYFALRSLDAQIVASDETLRAAQESLRLATRRADAGIASALDVYQADGLRSQASAQAKELTRQRAVIVHQLGVLTGEPALTLAAGDLASLPVPPLPPPGLPSELLERRPDVRVAEANLAAATERIGFAKGSQFPALTLTGAYGRQSDELGALFSSGSPVWSVGLGLLGPILDGGRYAARTQQAEAQARQAQASYEEAVRNAFRDVVDALSNVKLAEETHTELTERVDVARKTLRLATLRYERGYSAYLEVLDAQRTLNLAQLELIRIRQAYLSYTVDLMNALGGGWSPA